MSVQAVEQVRSVSLAPDSAEPAVSADEFKASFRHHPGGVAIVTADAGDGPVAMTATSVFSVSVDPPLFVFSASELSSSTPTISASETIVVHLPSADQLDLAVLASTSGADRFPAGRWARLATGEPMYPDVPVWIRGRIVNRLTAGASTVFVVEALGTSASAADAPTEAGRPLVYHNRTWHALDDASML